MTTPLRCPACGSKEYTPIASMAKSYFCEPCKAVITEDMPWLRSEVERLRLALEVIATTECLCDDLMLGNKCEPCIARAALEK